MIYDFHTHTCLSDGELSPIELIRRAAAVGYKVIAVTDHSGLGSMERAINEIAEDCRIASSHWDIVAIPGIELTHLPAHSIPQAAKQAKQMGAHIVVVHGETITEPVEKGTNLYAVQSSDVDILAHPGLITAEEARLAAENGVFIEITSRKGHSLTNGHVARLAKVAGAKMLLNSDTHAISDLLTYSFAVSVLKGATLEEEQLHQIMSVNPLALLKKKSLPGLEKLFSAS